VWSGSAPLSCGVFLPLLPSQLSCSWLLGMCPHSCRSFSSQAKLIYLQFWEGSPSPVLRSSGCPTLFATCLYCSYCLLLCFSFFPVWKSVCPGGYAVLAQGCLWKYHVPLSSPCLPKPSGCGWLVVAQGPSGFLHLMWSGDSLRRLEVWSGQSFASSRWFCLQGVSPVSLQDFTIGGTLSASSL
jgi:hypothetical protein